MKFEIVKEGIDVEQIANEINQRMECWRPLRMWSPDAPEFEGGGMIPLTMASNENTIYHTMYYDYFPALQSWITQDDYGLVQQSGIYGLLQGMETPANFDLLPYNQGRTRYCLTIGDSKFITDGEEHVVPSGTLFRYDDTVEHKWLSNAAHCMYFMFSVPKVETTDPIVLELEPSVEPVEQEE